MNQLIDELQVPRLEEVPSAMILPDVNLLLHAYNSGFACTRIAPRTWLEDLMNGERPVGLAWVVILGFRAHRDASVGVVDVRWRPKTPAASFGSWLDRPQAGILHPGERHAEILFALLESLGTAGNLTTDAHLAALAIEHQAELHSTDVGFLPIRGIEVAESDRQVALQSAFRGEPS